MNCAEFEAALQQQTDGRLSEHDEASLRKHAQVCHACQELEDGFRLVVQAFAATRLPVPAKDLTQRIMLAAAREAVLAKQPGYWWRGPAPRLVAAAAATVLLAIGWWLLPSPGDNDQPPPISLDQSPLTTHLSPTDDLLFPELADADSSNSQGAVLPQAVEPMSQIFRAVGRSLAIPVRPIASVTSDALDTLMSELPDPGLPEMPGLRDLMPRSMKKEMPTMRPSS